MELEIDNAAASHGLCSCGASGTMEGNVDHFAHAARSASDNSGGPMRDTSCHVQNGNVVVIEGYLGGQLKDSWFTNDTNYERWYPLESSNASLNLVNPRSAHAAVVVRKVGARRGRYLLARWVAHSGAILPAHPVVAVREYNSRRRLVGCGWQHPHWPGHLCCQVGVSIRFVQGIQPAVLLHIWAGGRP